MDSDTNRDENDGSRGNLKQNKQGIVYLVEFKDIQSGKKFYKTGVTSNSVSWRFDSNLFSQDRHKYNEFIITPIRTIKTPNIKIAERIENKIQEMFPKNFFLEVYLGKPFNYYSNGFTGVSETFIQDDKIKLKDVISVFDKISKKLEIKYG